MSPALPVVSGRQLVRALEKAGFRQISQKGSHIKMRNDAGRTVIVPSDLTVSPPVSPHARAPSSITDEQPVEGELIAHLRDHWTFQGSAGDTVTIRLTSEEFDPYLELFGPDWVLLVSDDDSGGDSNALIARFALPSSGTYTIVASGYLDTESGPYELTLELN